VVHRVSVLNGGCQIIIRKAWPCLESATLHNKDLLCEFQKKSSHIVGSKQCPSLPRISIRFEWQSKVVTPVSRILNIITRFFDIVIA
jgi:hypothetical protein